MFKKFKDLYEQHLDDVYYFSIGSTHVVSKMKNIRKYVQDYLGKERVFISTINYQDCSTFTKNHSIIKSQDKTYTKTRKHLFTTLITTIGVVENRHKINEIDQVVTMDDLFV